MATNLDDNTNDLDTDIDVEAIMKEVRESLQANRRQALAQGLKPHDFTFDDYPEEPTNDPYDVDLYAHLRLVNQPHRILGMRRMMRSSWLSRLPVIGGIWRRIQREGHDLVIFYVGALANEIATFQRYVAGVLNRLVGWSQKKDEQIRVLQEEIAVLKERLQALERDR